MNFTHSCQNERGAVLIISLVFLVLLSLIGSTAVLITTTDMKIGISHNESTQALIDADTGVNYAIAQMDAGFKAGTFALPVAIGDTSNLTSSSFTPPPTGFNFAYNPTTLEKVGVNRYEFTTVGSSTNNSMATIVVTCQQRPAITMAAFGDKKLDGKSGGQVKSFKSNSADPTKNDPTFAGYVSTHEADVGSNEWLVAHSGVDVDGKAILGEDVNENDATNSIADPTDFYNEAPVDDERIDPDPLGVTSGGEYDPTTYAASNQNCTGCTSAPPAVCSDLCTKNELDLGNADTATLTAGDYYINSGKGLELGNNSVLTIDGSAGEVRIFLDGEGVTSANSSTVNVITDATDFSIFSNSTVKIEFKNNSDFAGLVYAPYAPVDIKNNGTFTGAVWGSNVDIKNGGTVYYDSTLADKFLSKDIEIVTWQDFRI